MNFFKKSQALEFPKDVKISDKIFLIEVVLSNKKNSSVVLKDDTLVFRLTANSSKKQIMQHFNELFKKMLIKLEKKPVLKVNKFEDILSNSKFNFAGEDYLLEYSKNRGVKLKENTFFINIHTKKELIEKYIVKLLSDRYYERLKNYLDVINSQTYNFNVRGFDLKLVGSKWGHCTHDNRIMINLKLLNAQKAILDYVIIHELAHIRVKNHSAQFWREVEKFCPNYRELRKSLKQNPPQLFN